MIWIAVVIGVFLFYQFVPLKHKKILVGIAVVLAVGMTIFIGYSDYQSKQRWKKRKNGATVNFVVMDDIEGGSRKNIFVKVCNKRETDLLSYEVHISGKKNGRSGLHKISDRGYSDEYSEFESDVIIKPGKCDIIGWTGEYTRFDEYITELPTYHLKWSGD
jgi:hypothetical protein